MKIDSRKEMQAEDNHLGSKGMPLFESSGNIIKYNSL